MDENILIICPAYNEESNIEKLLILLKDLPYDVIIVDDGSTDKTKEFIIKHRIDSISHRQNKGKGAAIQTGITHFLSKDYDIAIFMDSDGQHKLEDIFKFIEYFRLHPKCDVILGSRFGDGRWKQNMPFSRKLSNLLSRFGIWILYNKLVIHDPQNGFRAYRRQCLETLRYSTTGFEAETEMIIESYLQGYSFGTIHIESIYNLENNNSKFSLLRDTWRIPGIMLQKFFEKKPFMLRNKNQQLAYRNKQKQKL
ncbi:MAG: glycosyltransferase family 2 protein [Candidatus Heimdallarchaeota archaeon]|nr:glycosyltransferase family 2 protein [Candidatus Heimdallarchaeota archaeon]MDH5647333.1 glycosyltransferase family 2 protein [Candidatus Heimdallarchaeota archaeon]